ncbi:cytosine permease [Alicyclobacillus sp. SO9]|uniref:purine-cytosine permease family protein n=1 Tax=Alicyclobacillus sp. SO9 TaxID=2665646 RepID=UPI0018E87DC5|nr:cytosine permease [Alicyclobacillus sp. SO9]QQE79679.1 cytosine permease [Alicyclobacillus sp. SO9]
MKQNQLWKSELNGVNVIQDDEKTATPRDLFWIWFGANIGILGILYGGIIVGFKLSFLQSILAAAMGALSFALVGLLSLSGRDESVPMFVLSRRVFGHRGNWGPGVVNWINLLGWESVTVVTGTLTLQALISDVFRVPTTLFTGIVSLVVFIGLVISFSLFGYMTLLFIQKVASWGFGTLTLFVIFLLLRHATWTGAVFTSSGQWVTGFLPAVSIIVAGTGISWAPAAADYSRYVSRSAKSGRLGWAVTLGGAIPLFVLMLTGILIAHHVLNLVSSPNPILTIGSALPGWMSPVYLVTVIGGLLAEADLSLYSSGLNLMGIGIQLPRKKTIWIDAVITIVVTVFVIFIRKNFFSPFEAFLTLMGVSLAAWSGVFLGRWMNRHRFNRDFFQHHETGQPTNWYALGSWGISVVVGLLFTTTSIYTGPLAKGVFSVSNLGIVLAFLVGIFLQSVRERLFGGPSEYTSFSEPRDEKSG